MDSARWNKIQELFEAALDREREEREAFLRDACAGDDELLREVKSLLAEDEAGHSLLEGLAVDAVGLSQELSMEGKHVGPYRIVKQIATGGMGAVYLAERDDGQFEQKVALKLIKKGMDSEAILRRFQGERQILARLRHPNIAQLLDGGLTENGLPYFTMEYVEGDPIDAYCDKHRLTIDQRLKLFLDVCEVVQYAERNLVVHRDLKPSNIMVTREGVVKLLDFGIAKVVGEGPDIPEMTALTRTGFRVMTPGYAAPEQVRGEPISTATDVYSLGVVLYELLTGHRPYLVKATSPREIEQIICTTQPDRPSNAIERPKEDETRAVDSGKGVTVSEARSTQPDKLRKRLAGDLDNICLMALRKEAERRYSSAGDFREDIKRHLGGLPVMARSDTLRYRVQKFVSRHRVFVTAAAAIFVFVVGLTAFYTHKVTQERDRARLEARKAEQVSKFLTGLFEVSDPSQSKGETVTARELLDRGSSRVHRELADQPEVQATMMDVMGKVYQSLGLYNQADTLLREALAIRERIGGGRVDLSETLHDLGMNIVWGGEDLDSAQSLLEESLRLAIASDGESSTNAASVYHSLAILHNTRGEYDTAETLYRKALGIFEQYPPEDYQEIGPLMNDLALVLHEEGKYADAEAMFRKTIDLERQLFGDVHPELATTIYNFGQLLKDRGNYVESEKMLREGLEMDKKVYGEKHPDVAYSLTGLGHVLERRGDLIGADSLYRQALQIRRDALGDSHPEVAVSMKALGQLLVIEGEYDEAETMFRKALSMAQRNYGESHPEIATMIDDLGEVLYERGEYDKAVDLHKQAMAMKIKWRGETSLAVAISLHYLSKCDAAKGDVHGAVGRMVESLDMLHKLFGPEHPYVASAMTYLADFVSDTGDVRTADSLYLGAIAMVRQLPGVEESNIAGVLHGYGRLLEKENLPDSAEAVYRKALEIRERDLSPSHLATAATRIGLGRVLTQKGEYGEAEQLLRQGLRTRTNALPAGNWQIADAQSELGACLMGSKRYDEAEQLLTEAYTALSNCKGNRRRQTREAVQRLAQLYDLVGKSGKADRYRSLLASLK